MKFMPIFLRAWQQKLDRKILSSYFLQLITFKNSKCQREKQLMRTKLKCSRQNLFLIFVIVLHVKWEKYSSDCI